MRNRLFWLVALILFAQPLGLLAETPSRQHRLRANASFTEPDYDDHDSGHGDEGFGLAWETLFNRRVGLGVSAFTSRLTLWPGWSEWSYQGRPHERVRMTPLAVTTNIHMTPGRPVDFYLAPGLAWVTFSEDSGANLEDGFAPLFEVGIDVAPGDSPFGFHLDLKHIFHSANHGSPDFDSLTLSLGFVARF